MRRRVELYVEPALPRVWDLFVVGCTVASLALLLVDAAFEPGSEAARTLAALDLAFCALFVVDFGLRLARARVRGEFVRRNWVDLLGAVPVVGPLAAMEPLRLLRIVRLVRLVALGRRLLRRTAGLPVDPLRHLALLALVFWLFAGVAFYAFEHGHNPNVARVDDGLWWSMTTLSTVGYGDTFPTTEGGRLVAMVTMVFGVGVLATLAGGIASVLTELRERGRRGLGRVRVRNHLLVLGWTDDAALAVDEFRKDPRHRDTPVVVVAERDAAPCEGPGIHFVRGAPERRESLERACATDAAAAIVWPADPADPRSDQATALTAMALRRLSPGIAISASLVSPANRELLETAGCDAIVDRASVNALLLVRTAQDVGLAEVLDDLLRNDGGSELYRAPVDEAFVGRTVGDYARALVDRATAVVALARAEGDDRPEQLLVSPDPTLVLRADDEVFLVSRR